jgi:hypothetical protein
MQFRFILLFTPLLLGLVSCKRSTQVTQVESSPVVAHTKSNK